MSGALDDRRRFALAPVALLAVWLAATLGTVGAYRFIEPDEGRNAGAALEVATRGGWTLPRYDGLPLLDKPPLWFDLAAAAMLVAGPSELAARLPSLLATALTVALTGAFAARLFGRAAAAPAALALAGTPLVTAYAGIAIFDATMALFVTAALMAGYQAVEEWGAIGRRGDARAAGPSSPGWECCSGSSRRGRWRWRCRSSCCCRGRCGAVALGRSGAPPAARSSGSRSCPGWPAWRPASRATCVTSCSPRRGGG